MRKGNMFIMNCWNTPGWSFSKHKTHGLECNGECNGKRLAFVSIFDCISACKKPRQNSTGMRYSLQHDEWLDALVNTSAKSDLWLEDYDLHICSITTSILHTYQKRLVLPQILAKLLCTSTRSKLLPGPDWLYICVSRAVLDLCCVCCPSSGF